MGPAITNILSTYNDKFIWACASIEFVGIKVML